MDLSQVFYLLTTIYIVVSFVFFIALVALAVIVARKLKKLKQELPGKLAVPLALAGLASRPGVKSMAALAPLMPFVIKFFQALLSSRRRGK